MRPPTIHLHAHVANIKNADRGQGDSTPGANARHGNNELTLGRVRRCLAGQEERSIYDSGAIDSATTLPTPQPPCCWVQRARCTRDGVWCFHNKVSKQLQQSIKTVTLIELKVTKRQC